MQSSLLLINVCATALASAGCFTSGDTWGAEKPVAISAVEKLCNDGTLSGGFKPNQFKFGCGNLSSSKKVDFRVAADNLDELLVDSVGIPAWQCIEYLSAEINGCGQGGSTSRHFSGVGSITFTSDPNSGNCV